MAEISTFSINAESQLFYIFCAVIHLSYLVTVNSFNLIGQIFSLYYLILTYQEFSSFTL